MITAFRGKMVPIDERIARVLADTNPEMKHASDYPELRKRVKVFLDGEDVTGICRAFSIPAQSVELYLEEGGKKLLDWSCACGTTRGSRRPERSTPPFGICSVCGETVEMAVAIDTRSGRVEVVAVSSLALPPEKRKAEEGAA